jgi:quercetin dioxygenase-like cupin family protein
MMRLGREGLVGIVGLGLMFACGGGVRAQAAGDYARASSGTRELTLAGGTAFRMLLDETNLGSGEIEMAEITLPAGTATAAHRHQSMEIFYVLEGTLGHVVNGVEYQLKPGMVGVVKPGDDVAHRAPDGPVKALVVWVPGGEGDRIAPRERWTPIGN